MRNGDEMNLRMNDIAPDFVAETTEGLIQFHDWIGDDWAMLFSHPKDFTPVCTTELGALAAVRDEFAARGCKVIGISVDRVEDHLRWSEDIARATGSRINFPMIGDPRLEVAKLYGMLPADAGDTAAGRTPADNATVRSVFLIGPDKKIKAMLSYPMTTGRSFDEIVRLLDSVQLTAREKVATPANWTQGDDVIVVPAVSDAEAEARYGGIKEAPLPYLRYVEAEQLSGV
jgi:alkyl hydroperoxide reductase subunit AhpC